MSFPFGKKDGTLLITTKMIAIEEGVTVMTTSYYADRANVYRLFHLHPDWTQPQLAQATGRSLGWVKKCEGGWCRFTGQGATGQSFDGFIAQERLWGVYPKEKIE